MLVAGPFLRGTAAEVYHSTIEALDLDVDYDRAPPRNAASLLPETF